MDQPTTPPVTTVQFCKLRIENKLFYSSEQDVVIDFGLKDNPVFKENDAIIQATSKVTEYYTLVDALNYMSSIGWEVVLAIPVPLHKGSLNVEFIMKMQFNTPN
jgi:hypothetical protein